MTPDKLKELAEKLRTKISSMERTIGETEQAELRSAHTEGALIRLRIALAAARGQLVEAEKLLPSGT